MKKIIILALSLISSIILNSCGLIKCVDPAPPPVPEPIVTEIINTGGVIMKGENSPRQLVLSQIGQEYTIKDGESIRMVLENMDMNTMTLDVVTDEATKAITLKLIHKDSARVVLTQKCQTVNRYNTNYIPKVEINCQEKEQVVTTPIYDDKCNVIGYQIRYGARERGCKDQETDKIYRRYKDCQDNGIVDGTNTQGTGDPKCDKLRKIGLPCN